MFPCFDQPDLKAAWTFTAITESDWTVISNEAEVGDTESAGRTESCQSGVEDARELFGTDFKFTSTKATSFQTSVKISTYLFAIVAGPFGYHEREAAGMPKMRIYARQSLVKDVNHADMFNATECGIRFYEGFFGREYPFRKYDQVFVPEFVSGAMEQVGCVTYNEAYLFRGKALTLRRKSVFTITNLHELAHMWFGNLVTM